MDKQAGGAINLEQLELRFQNMSQDARNLIQTKWDEVIDLTSDDPHTMWVYGIIIYTMVYYWLFGAFFTFMDITGRPKFLRRLKVQPGTNEPVEPKKLFNAILVVLFNQIFVTGPLTYITFTYVIDVNKFMPPIRELPTLFRAFTDILACVVLTEFFFYYSHRLLHNKYVYKHVHKKHHEWISPISITAEYCHPIEHIFSNVLSVSIGVAVMKTHYLTALIWFAFALTTTMSHHSGYWLPLSFNPEFHDFHHLKFNYCYGVTGFLDMIHGTDSLFRKYKAGEAPQTSPKKQKQKKTN